MTTVMIIVGAWAAVEILGVLAFVATVNLRDRRARERDQRAWEEDQRTWQLLLSLDDAYEHQPPANRRWGAS